jgi:hypothetical protein
MEVNEVKEIEEVKEKQISALAGEAPFGRDGIEWGHPPPPPQLQKSAQRVENKGREFAFWCSGGRGEAV